MPKNLCLMRALAINCIGNSVLREDYDGDCWLPVECEGGSWYSPVDGSVSSVMASTMSSAMLHTISPWLA